MAELYELHEQLAAVCPIESVSKSKVIIFGASATQGQRDAARAVADAFDFNAPSDGDAMGARRFDGMDKTEKAILLLMRNYCNAIVAGTQPNKTLAALKADFITAFKALQ